jgi:hypothetical protein
MLETQRSVSGDVRLRAEAPGLLRVVGRRSPKALYDHGLATYDAADSFRHEHSEGFVRLWGLGIATWAARRGRRTRRLANNDALARALQKRDGLNSVGSVGELQFRSGSLAL